MSRPHFFPASPVALAIGALLLVQGAAASRPPRRRPSQEPVLGLRQLVGPWRIVANTFGPLPNAQSCSFHGVLAANGRAVYTTYSHGAGADLYEANSIWAYDAGRRQVRVFEVNSNGLVAEHVGAFNPAGALITDRRASDTGALLQHSVLMWTGDTLRFTATFPSDTGATAGAITFVRCQ